MADRLHILIVEDEPLGLDALHSMLEADYNVSSVRTVGDACACLRTSHIDVVLVDWQLPDGRGDAVAECAEKCSVPIITMSGYPYGMNGRRPHLMKPFGADALDVEIRSVTNRRSDARQAAMSEGGMKPA